MRFCIDANLFGQKFRKCPALGPPVGLTNIISTGQHRQQAEQDGHTQGGPPLQASPGHPERRRQDGGRLGPRDPAVAARAHAQGQPEGSEAGGVHQAHQGGTEGGGGLHFTSWFHFGFVFLLISICIKLNCV